LFGEVVAFGGATRACRGVRVVLGRSVEVAGPLVKVGADGVEPVVAGQPHIETVDRP
jgi:hypothetical protein